MRSSSLVWVAALMVALPVLAQSAAQSPTRPSAWTSSGPPYPGVHAIVAAPDDDQLVYAGAGDGDAGPSALFLSRDAGRSWVDLAAAPAGERVSGIAIDPLNSANVIAATRLQGTTTLYQSSDRGATWERAMVVEAGCGSSIVFEHRANSALVSCGPRLLRSDDGGIRWAWIAGPASDAVGLVASPDGSLFAYGIDAIFRSENIGLTWSLVGTAPSTCPAITALAMPPDSPMTLLAGTSILGHPWYGGGCGGVFRSIDGGASWEATDLDGSPRHISDIQVDPRDASRVFASAVTGQGIFRFLGGVFMSEDGGETWKDLGFPTRSAFAIAMSSSGRTVYVNSDGVLFQHRFRRPVDVAPRAP